MAVKLKETADNIAPNLVPMVDIVFLILLFFMLNADMSQRELEDVVLPTAEAVKEDKGETPKGTLPRVNVNVYHSFDTEKCPYYPKEQPCIEESHWAIGVKGIDYNPETIKALLQKEADLERKDASNLQISERRVMIRADKAAIYGYVQKVMNACAEVGIYKVEIGAATKMPGT